MEIGVNCIRRYNIIIKCRSYSHFVYTNLYIACCTNSYFVDSIETKDTSVIDSKCAITIILLQISCECYSWCCLVLIKWCECYCIYRISYVYWNIVNSTRNYWIKNIQTKGSRICRTVRLHSSTYFHWVYVCGSLGLLINTNCICSS